jgi:hypothetical protein
MQGLAELLALTAFLLYLRRVFFFSPSFLFWAFDGPELL